MLYKSNIAVEQTFISQRNKETKKHTNSVSYFRSYVRLRSKREKVATETVLESAVATTDDGSGGEARNGGLQGFLSSLFSTLGGVFGSTFQETQQNVAMASVAEQPNNGFCFSFCYFCSFLAANLIHV